MIKKRKRLILLIACVAFQFNIQAQIFDSAYKPGWKMVFQDEFEQNKSDGSKWMNRFPWGPCVNDNLAYFTDGKNCSLTDGKLHLTAQNGPVWGPCWNFDSAGNIKEMFSTYEYTSGLVYSLKAFKYGYFECRFKAAAGKGFNSAFWLYGAKACEIDVFEILGSTPQKAQITLHWLPAKKGGRTQQFYDAELTSSSFDQEYHTMAVKWDASELVWYLDGNEIRANSKSRKIWRKHIPDVDLSLILDLGIGMMDGKPDQTTPFPADFIIDYVRAYQQQPDLPGPEILGQRSVPSVRGNPVLIRLEDLEVSDPKGTYPAGYRLKILNGENYSVSGSIVSPVSSFKGTLLVRVVVNDGLKDSNPFDFNINQR